MLRNVLILAAALTAISTGVMAGGTPEEQAACRPDVRKYCPALGTDEFVILACLQQNREKLTRPCRKVLESHGV